MAKSSGKNPMKYSEIFDFSDKSVVTALIGDIKKVDAEYTKMAKSIDAQAKVARDSFVRSANEIIAATQRLNASRADDREQLRLLAEATDQLRQRQTKQRQNEEEGTRTKKFAADSVKGLKAEINALVKEYDQLSNAEDKQAARMKEIADKVKALKLAQKTLTDELKLVKQQADAVTGSYKALEMETKKLTDDLKKMAGGFDSNNKEAEKLKKQIFENNARLKEFDASINVHNRNVGNYKEALGAAGSQLKAFALGLAAAYLGFQSLNQFATKVVDTNVQISDSLSDVQRTAQLTAKEADALVNSLKQLDTRTGLKGLVDLATIGGQLGVPKAELVGFVKAIDQLTVSLKGEISGGAEAMAKSLGKINAVFKVASTEGVDTEQAMLKTGSAILKLGQAGLATGDYLADFGQRLGGIASNAGIGLPKVLAYGAVLEELGISAEVSGTAMGQLINTMAKSPEAFFKVAKLGDATLKLKDFTKTINTDTAGALDQLFKGLNAGGSSLTDFSELVGSLGLRGTRTVSVISALAKNTELIETRTKQATAAYKDGTLATEQFQIKNTNLAASLEKLNNAILNTFVNSPFSREVAKFINQMIDGKTEGDHLTEAFVEQRKALEDLDAVLPTLLGEYDRLKAKAKELGGENKLTEEEQAKLNDTMNEIGKLLPEVISQVDKYGNVISIARDKVNSLTDAMRTNLQQANRSAAAELREENAVREKKIQLLQKEIETNATGRTVERANELGTRQRGGGLVVDKGENRELIAQQALKEAEAIKKLKDVLLQELSPAEQEVYDKFYKSQKKTTDAAAELALAQKTAGEEAGKASTNLEEFGKKGARVKTEFEKLEDQVKKLENQIRSQAISGKVSKDTLDQLVAASDKLRNAQEAGDMAIQKALDPYKALQMQVAILTEQLEKEVVAGKDTTNTVNALSIANSSLLLVQNEVKLAMSETVSTQEQLNTKLEITRKELERQAANGKINNTTLNTYNGLVLKIRDNNEALQLSILQVTDPMAAMALQAEQLKRILTEQALAGDVSAEKLDEYRAILIKIAEAQAKLNAVNNFNPLDPKGNIAAADLALEKNQRALNGVVPQAEGGVRAAIRAQQALEQDRLRLTMERLQAEQDTLREGSKEWEHIETEKTRVLADQERLRNKISQDSMAYRMELAAAGLELLGQAVDGYFEMEKEKANAQLEQLQKDKEKELAIVGNNANARAAIEAKYEQKQKEIKRRQAQQEKTQALFQIAIETAIGAAKSVASSPLTYGMPWLAFVLAQGALQAALVAARPIPQFEKGTMNAPEGVALVAEKGQEAIRSKRDGSVRLTGHNAHYEYLHAGDQVFRADSVETKRYQQLAAENGIDAGRMYVDSTGAIINAKMDYDTRLTANAIERLNKTVAATSQAASSDNGKVVAAITNGNIMVTKAIRENKPKDRKPQGWSYKIRDKADYVHKNMFS